MICESGEYFGLKSVFELSAILIKTETVLTSILSWIPKRLVPYGLRTQAVESRMPIFVFQPAMVLDVTLKFSCGDNL
ncbi:hypothetical protein LEMLEM_LOCUS10153 [Lemmus lemmus]